jgi:hypothetical protein
MLNLAPSKDAISAPHGHRQRWRRVYRALVAALAGCLVAINTAVLVVYVRESRDLEKIAASLVAPTDSALDKVRKVASFVTETVPTGRVDTYFLLPVFRPLKPTALQVIRGGGDCAYKARAYIVLMKHLGMQASKIALHDAHGRPVHAVAVTETPQGPVVVDLLYGIVYTDQAGLPIPLEELEADASRMNEVLDREIARGNLRAGRYPRHRYDYHDVRTINWDKSWATSRLRALLGHMFGMANVDELRRPRWSEEPAHIVALASGVLVVAAALPYGIRSWRHRETL